MKNHIETQKTRERDDPDSLEVIKERLKVKNLVDVILEKEARKRFEKSRKILREYLETNGCIFVKEDEESITVLDKSMNERIYPLNVI